MRATLLVLTIVAASFLAHSDAWAAFNCFETPEGRRCACVGDVDCSEMRKSDNCKSGLECDNSQLGALICSCEAQLRASSPSHRNERSRAVALASRFIETTFGS